MWTLLAKGIETTEQFKQIEQLKCNVAQGYLFDKLYPRKKLSVNG